MTKQILLLLSISISLSVHAQDVKKWLKKAKKSSALVQKVDTLLPKKPTESLSTIDVANGLKEALQVAAEKSANQLSKPDAFFKNALLKIPIPPEAQKAERGLRNFGMGKQVDDAIESMNHAAEDASSSAAPIFVSAIKQMSFDDAMSILKGSDTAATKYLKEKTLTQLTDLFKPIIQTSLEKVNATKYWTAAFTTYNKFGLNKVSTDLPAYVTEKALVGLFHQVATEELNIRKDPLARSTELLQKVFGSVQK